MTMQVVMCSVHIINSQTGGHHGRLSTPVSIRGQRGQRRADRTRQRRKQTNAQTVRPTRLSRVEQPLLRCRERRCHIKLRRQMSAEKQE